MRLLKSTAMVGLALWAFGVNGCFSTGGDGTETGNALTGQLFDENGATVGLAQVTAYSLDHDPALGESVSARQRVVSDAQGRFKFDSLPKGIWNLEARDPSRRLAGLHLQVQVDSNHLDLPHEILHAPGNVIVDLEDSLAFAAGSYLYAPGTSAFARLDAESRHDHRAVLYDIPAGLLPRIYLATPKTAKDTAGRRIALADSIAVPAGGQAHLTAFARWTHHLNLQFNTDANGLGLKQGLNNFTVPLRLRRPQFDFTASRNDGGDIRITNPDGEVIPFAMEQFDSSAGEAVLWVRLDLPKSNTASLTLHYGQAKAQMPSYPVLFDTADGYGGTWHLAEEKPGITQNGLYRDASNANHQGDDRISSTGREGILGWGKTFVDGDYIEVPTLHSVQKSKDAFTLSAWVRCRGVGTSGGEVVSIGDNYSLRISPTGNLYSFIWPPVDRSDTSLPWYPVTSTGVNLKDSVWHFIAVTYDGKNLELYLDGLPSGEAPAPLPVGYAQGKGIVFGMHGNKKTGFNFVGDMDEVQAHAVSRSAEWIRASYESQKPTAKWITVE
jgi:hypothetical protein